MTKDFVLLCLNQKRKHTALSLGYTYFIQTNLKRLLIIAFWERQRNWPANRAKKYEYCLKFFDGISQSVFTEKKRTKYASLVYATLHREGTIVAKVTVLI